MNDRWLSPGEARARFGNLTTTSRSGVTTWPEFVDEHNYVWVPQFDSSLALAGYARRIGYWDDDFPGAPAELKSNQRKIP